MKLLNFGSLNIDYVYHVEHFVRAGETVQSYKMTPFCGGKGFNQTIATARAGVPIAHAGKIGREKTAFEKIMREAKVNMHHIVVSDKPTGHAIIQVDKTGQNCILLYPGANHDMDKAFIDSVLAEYSAGDLLLLQNEVNNLSYIMEQAHKKGMKIVLNPSPISEELLDCPLQYASWFLVNEIEGEALSGEKDPNRMTEVLLKKYPESAIVLTLGSKGVQYRDAHTIASHGVYDVEIVDTTGAGDTFTGYFMQGIYSGMPIHNILQQASIASALAISRKGASSSIPTMEEVKSAKFSLLKE